MKMTHARHDEDGSRGIKGGWDDEIGLFYSSLALKNAVPSTNPYNTVASNFLGCSTHWFIMLKTVQIRKRLELELDSVTTKVSLFERKQGSRQSLKSLSIVASSKALVVQYSVSDEFLTTRGMYLT